MGREHEAADGEVAREMTKPQNPTYMFNKSTLVLEGVTLAQVVELVVKVLVDFASGTVLGKETAEDSETAHP